MANFVTCKVLQPTGILTASTSTGLNQEVQSCLENATRTILIDLQAVDFIDSSGLGVLVSMHTKLRLAGGKLYFCSPQDQARNLFRIADMEQIFTVFATREAFENAIVKKNPTVLVQ